MSLVRVWDLPTRLFHWALASLVLFSVVTAKIGGGALEWHMASGFLILALLLFRVLWGLAGDRYALFASFVRGPRTVAAYLRALVAGAASSSGEDSAGHNPLGALSVMALLGDLLLQAGTGLFASDDTATEGPYAHRVTNVTVRLLTRIHHFNEKILYLLLALHLAAIAYYALAKHENLLWPMVSGDKTGVDAVAAEDSTAIRLRAVILLALAIALIEFLVRL